MRGRAMETAGNIRYPTLRQKLTSGATNAPGVNQRSVSPKIEREQHAGEKRWNGHEHLIRNRQRLVKAAARVPGGEDAERDGDHHDQQKRQRRQKRRDRELPREHLGNGHGIAVGRAEVAAQRAKHPLAVPHEKRPVEPHLMTQRLDGLDGRVAAELIDGGVAGDNLEGQKREKRDDHHRQQHHGCFLRRILHGDRLFSL